MDAPALADDAPAVLAPAARDGDGGPGAIDGVRVGIGGWIYAPWRHSFYPPHLPLRRELHYASRQVGSIEVNSTFYGAEPPDTYARWAAEVPTDFVFSVRAPRHVTERGPLARARIAVRGFVSGLAGFGGRLGPVVWQLPPNRGFDAADLGAFFDQLPRELDGRPLRHALDVRHPSFVDPAYVELARTHGVATVFTDAPGLPALADLSGPFVYVRLTRARRVEASGYQPSEIARWATLARRWASGEDPVELPHARPPLPPGGLREVFVQFTGGARQRDPAAAMAMIACLEANDGTVYGAGA